MRDFKFLTVGFVPCLLLLACNSGPISNQPTDSVKENPVRNIQPQNSSLCFQHVEKQDTASVHLILNGSVVSGEFFHVPFEKDSRKGTIYGTKQGNLIKGMWSYMQEGMMDSLEVQFKLDNNQLIQKEYSVDTNTGRQVLKDTSRFSILFTPIDCETFPGK